MNLRYVVKEINGEFAVYFWDIKSSKSYRTQPLAEKECERLNRIHGLGMMKAKAMGMM